jgi:cytoskeletal protein CcmA (bactofilin family)
MSHRTRRLLGLVFGVFLAMVAAFAVLADGGGASDKVRSGQDIVIPAGTTVDHDLYIFASSVTIAGTINGDLVVAAARVTIDGTVTGDALIAASEVAVRGTVGGDVRAAAAQVTIVGTVSKDVAVATSSLLLGGAGRVGQDLLFAASNVALDGNVAGGIAGTASDYRRRGTVGGTEQVTLAARLDQPAPDRTAALALDAIRQYILVVLFGLAMLRFAPRVFRATADRARSQPLLAAGVGVLALLGYVAALILLVLLMVVVSLIFGRLDFGGFVAIDIIGSILAILGLTFGLIVFSAFIADAVVGLAIGRLVSLAESSRWADVIRLAIGAWIVVIVTSFPGVGGIIKFLVILVGLGAFCNVIWESRQRGTVVVPVAPPPLA